MTKSAVEVLEAILANPTDLENVAAHTTPDVKYVSLNWSNPDLTRVMPWAGSGTTPAKIVKTFVDVGRFWEVLAFEPQATFGDDTNAAMFGKFVYRSTVLGKEVTSPFAIWAKVVDGKCTYLQFMEDTLATTESFRKSGQFVIHSDPDGAEFTL